MTMTVRTQTDKIKTSAIYAAVWTVALFIGVYIGNQIFLDGWNVFRISVLGGVTIGLIVWESLNNDIRWSRYIFAFEIKQLAPQVEEDDESEELEGEYTNIQLDSDLVPTGWDDYQAWQVCVAIHNNNYDVTQHKCELSAIKFNELKIYWSEHGILMPHRTRKGGVKLTARGHIKVRNVAEME